MSVSQQKTAKTHCQNQANSAAHKAAVRTRVWSALRLVALPDSRFHYDFSSFIPDFALSHVANDKLLALLLPSLLSKNSCVFIAPDNCLAYLRERALAAGVKVLVTTYGIRRGFWLLDPAAIGGGGKDDTKPSALWRLAATLDGMEALGRAVTLAEIVELGLEVKAMVTGTGAINMSGVRFGKGHGFFDLEWGMLFSRGLVGERTLTAAVVHDCQVLEEELVPEVWDTVCDLVVTPTRVIEVEVRAGGKPTCGILWERLEGGMLEGIPPLRELKEALVSE